MGIFRVGEECLSFAYIRHFFTVSGLCTMTRLGICKSHLPVTSRSPACLHDKQFTFSEITFTLVYCVFFGSETAPSNAGRGAGAELLKTRRVRSSECHILPTVARNLLRLGGGGTQKGLSSSVTLVLSNETPFLSHCRRPLN